MEHGGSVSAGLDIEIGSEQWTWGLEIEVYTRTCKNTPSIHHVSVVHIWLMW